MTSSSRVASMLTLVLSFFLGSSLAQAPAAPPPVPANVSPLFVVTYVEAKSTSSAEAVALLKAYRDSSSTATGNLRSLVVQRIDRAGQFVVITTWKDNEAWDGHMAAAATRDFRGKLAALRSAPIDDRLHRSFSVGQLDDPKIAGAVYAVTHVDVIPQRREDAEAALQALAEANRKANGNLRYEVVQQANRPNHFTVFEIWRSRDAFDTNVMAAPQRAFRDTLGSMSGALYDERLYSVLPD